MKKIRKGGGREVRKKRKGEKDLIYRIENPLTHWSPS